MKGNKITFTQDALWMLRDLDRSSQDRFIIDFTQLIEGEDRLLRDFTVKIDSELSVTRVGDSRGFIFWKCSQGEKRVEVVALGHKMLYGAAEVDGLIKKTKEDLHNLRRHLEC